MKTDTMKMNTIKISVMRTLTVLAVLGGLAIPAFALELGDPAPPITATEWVRGDPVDLGKGKGKKVFLVEFWATWCPPCKVTIPRLTEFQKKYKKDLVIIGVTAPDSRGNSPSAVRKFVKAQGDKMQYTIALDKAEATSNAYMRAAEVMGIPYAFLVDRRGQLAWMGSPLDPALDTVMAEVVAGKYDVRTAKIRAKVENRMQGVFRAIQFGRTQVAWDGLIDVLKIDPDEETALELLIRIYVDQLRDKVAFRKWADGHIASHRDDATAMSKLTEAFCKIDDLTLRLPDLTLEAASAAYTAGKQKDAAAISAYARAFFEIGELDRAISLQRDALAVATAAQRDLSQGILDHYNTCKQLQASEN